MEENGTNLASEFGGTGWNKIAAGTVLGMLAWAGVFAVWQYLFGLQRGLDASSLYPHLASAHLEFAILRPGLNWLWVSAISLAVCTALLGFRFPRSGLCANLARTAFYVWLYLLVLGFALMLGAVSYLACSPRAYEQFHSAGQAGLTMTTMPDDRAGRRPSREEAVFPRTLGPTQ